MPLYQRAFVLTVDVDTPEDADYVAGEAISRLSNDLLDTERVESAIYEYDNEGQRVMYLDADPEIDREPDTSGDPWAI